MMMPPESIGKMRTSPGLPEKRPGPWKRGVGSVRVGIGERLAGREACRQAGEDSKDARP
jgi:hypothetical protein